MDELEDELTRLHRENESLKDQVDFATGALGKLQSENEALTKQNAELSAALRGLLDVRNEPPEWDPLRVHQEYASAVKDAQSALTSLGQKE